MKHDWEDSLTMVEPKVFKELIAAGAVLGATVRAADSGKGLLVILDVGQQQRILGQSRGRGPRYFQSFDGAASTLLQNGVTTFNGEMTGWTPKTEPKGVKRQRREVEAAASL